MIKEEEKQRIIVRQSQLKMAQEWAQSCGYCLDLLELITLSEVLTNYVMDGAQKEVITRIKNVDEHFSKKNDEKKR